jgi:hypothetical protein
LTLTVIQRGITFFGLVDDATETLCFLLFGFDPRFEFGRFCPKAISIPLKLLETLLPLWMLAVSFVCGIDDAISLLTASPSRIR